MKSLTEEGEAGAGGQKLGCQNQAAINKRKQNEKQQLEFGSSGATAGVSTD